MTLAPSERFLERLFFDPGEGSDVDEAFEDAVDLARVEYGLNGLVASVASLSASDVSISVSEPTSLARASLLAWREPFTLGAASARALASDSQFKRRRLNLKVEDDLELGAETGFLTRSLDAALEAVLLERAEAAGFALGEGEFLESVEVRSYRARYKPVVTAHPGRNKTQFLVREAGSWVPLASGATAGEARRAAVGLAKDGPLDGKDRFKLEVSAAARREDGSAIFEIERARVSQKATLRLTFASPKKPLLKTTGWLFSGRLDSTA